MWAIWKLLKSDSHSHRFIYIVSVEPCKRYLLGKNQHFILISSRDTCERKSLAKRLSHPLSPTDHLCQQIPFFFMRLRTQMPWNKLNERSKWEKVASKTLSIGIKFYGRKSNENWSYIIHVSSNLFNKIDLVFIEWLHAWDGKSKWCKLSMHPIGHLSMRSPPVNAILSDHFSMS